MTGQELYELWVATNDERGMGVDPWDALDDFDHECWDALAAKVQPA